MYRVEILVSKRHVLMECEHELLDRNSKQFAARRRAPVGIRLWFMHAGQMQNRCGWAFDGLGYMGLRLSHV